MFKKIMLIAVTVSCGMLLYGVSSTSAYLDSYDDTANAIYQTLYSKLLKMNDTISESSDDNSGILAADIAESIELLNQLCDEHLQCSSANSTYTQTYNTITGIDTMTVSYSSPSFAVKQYQLAFIQPPAQNTNTELYNNIMNYIRDTCGGTQYTAIQEGSTSNDVTEAIIYCSGININQAIYDKWPVTFNTAQCNNLNFADTPWADAPCNNTATTAGIASKNAIASSEISSQQQQQQQQTHTNQGANQQSQQQQQAQGQQTQQSQQQQQAQQTQQSQQQQQTGVPGTPSVSASQVGTTDSIQVTWTAPADNGNTITSYELQYMEVSYRSTDTWVSLGTVTGTTTSYTHNSLSRDYNHQYNVRAVNSVGSGSWGTSGIAALEGTVPGQVTSLAAAKDTSNSNLVNVSWGAPAHNGYSSVHKYQIEYQIDGGTWSSVMDVRWDSMSYSHDISSLSTNSTITYRVAAVNDYGSGSTDTVSITK